MLIQHRAGGDALRGGRRGRSWRSCSSCSSATSAPRSPTSARRWSSSRPTCPRCWPALRAHDRARARATTPPSAAAAGASSTHAQEAINPSLTAADVREMLIQHILTEEIFSKVFGEDDFHRQNNVARELYALEATFFTGNVKQRTLQGPGRLLRRHPRRRARRSAATTRSRPSSRSSTRTSTRSTTPRPPTGWAWSTRRTRSCAS
ncbi:MAG: hypothetical protein MZW92_38475 [Comamonadaceae bacterium]|nr:hypothetical protein [Comamonadaceae bacterium]